jgi:hypothetical protein
MFIDALAAQAPESMFAFEIEGRAAGPDGCNWFPLASIGAWRGDVSTNLAAFRRVRERLAHEYNLAEGEAAEIANARLEAEAGAA